MSQCVSPSVSVRVGGECVRAQLEAAYTVSPHPGLMACQVLASMLGLSVQYVQAWFQCRRSLERKTTLSRPSPLQLSPDITSSHREFLSSTPCCEVSASTPELILPSPITTLGCLQAAHHCPKDIELSPSLFSTASSYLSDGFSIHSSDMGSVSEHGSTPSLSSTCSDMLDSISDVSLSHYLESSTLNAGTKFTFKEPERACPVTHCTQFFQSLELQPSVPQTGRSHTDVSRREVCSVSSQTECSGLDFAAMLPDTLVDFLVTDFPPSAADSMEEMLSEQDIFSSTSKPLVFSPTSLCGLEDSLTEEAPTCAARLPTPAEYGWFGVMLTDN